MDGSDKPQRSPPLPDYLKRYLQSLGAAILHISGTYDKDTGLLVLTENKSTEITIKSDVLWGEQDFYLSAFNEYLSGPAFITETASDRVNKPGTLVLRRLE